jgi:uncharacterized protein (DUF885 family)
MEYNLNQTFVKTKNSVLNKSHYILFIFCVLLCSCKQNTTKEPMTKLIAPVNELFDRYYEDRLKLFPLDATLAGDYRYNDLLNIDISDSFRIQERSFYSKYLDDLKKYDRAGLSENEQISYDILKWECESHLQELKFPFNLMPVNQIFSLHLLIGQLAGGDSFQPFKTAKDYDNWLSRLRTFTVWCDTAIVNMRKGIKLGYVLPKSLTIKVIPQMAEFDHGPAEDHLFYTPIKKMPTNISNEDRIRLEKEYKALIKNEIIPTFKKFHDFLKNEYLPASRKTSGILYLPDGNKMYECLLKSFTTTNMSADEIFELGQAEVGRLTKEMKKVKDHVGFKGDLKSFFVFVRSDKKFMPYSDPEQVIAHFNSIYNTIKPNLKKLFDIAPKTPFEIRRTEAFREASASAEYFQGSVDGTRPGIFYVPVPNAASYNNFADEDLFLHEAIPGHHYQISIQQESQDLPKFRKILWNSAFGEGWALYTESLGKELGLYTDPYQYFGMLSEEMHRAIRLVVDVGIHSKGWTREEAIQYSLDREAESEDNITSEIERYMASPGQAVSYKIGQLKILALRSKAEKELGKKFDIREFHTKILESGVMPLNILESKIDRWIESKK